MPHAPSPVSKPPENSLATEIFAVVSGLFFFITILKFGNPIILDSMVTPPENFAGAIFDSWQIEWGFWLMVPMILAGLAAYRRPTLRFHWALALPAAWLGWQFISATHTVSPRLTSITLEHFSVCVILFYLAYFGLGSNRNPWPLWTGIALALCWTMRTGFEQHFGGLEATRKMLASMKDNAGLPQGIFQDPAYLKRMASNRIFGTFFYANALAGAVVLFLPVTLVFLWKLTPKVRLGIRLGFVVILGGAGLACLYWSGSKMGWLVMLVLAMVALAYSNIPLKWKRGLIYGVLFFGLIGFGVKYATFFEKQKNSVGARFTYWRAALQIVQRYPVLGSGPGTFGVLYAQLKKPDDEMARLCHNDYLEQACDSGLPGFVLYDSMIIFYLFALYRYRATDKAPFSYLFAVSLGVFGLCLHSLVEFHLYVPGLAWPFFFLLGWARGRSDYR